jgi:hypothetical protein
MTWQPGKDRINDLLGAGELERVTPDSAVARRLLADAGKHLDTAAAGVSRDDLAGAYQLGRPPRRYADTGRRHQDPGQRPADAVVTTGTAAHLPLTPW